MANIAKTYTFVNGQPADATQVNKNFDDIIAGVGDISAAGHALIDDANAAAQLATLGALPLAGGTLTGNLIAPMFASINLVLPSVSAAATTIYTFANAGLSFWIVSASTNTGDASSWGSTAFVHINEASARIVSVITGSNLTIALSGMNLQSTMSSGPRDIYLSLVRVA